MQSVCQMRDGEGHSLSLLLIRLRGRPLQAPHRVTPGGDAAAKGPVQVEAAAAAGAVQRLAHKVKAGAALELEIRFQLGEGKAAAGDLRLLPAAGGQALKAPVLGGVGQLLPLPGGENGRSVAVPQPGGRPHSAAQLPVQQAQPEVSGAAPCRLGGVGRKQAGKCGFVHCREEVQLHGRAFHRRGQVAGQVHDADAGQAVSLLPSKADQEPGRATKGAANTLLGNVYIVQKRWAEAEQVLKEVTGYELMTRYADVFELANKNGPESIFEIQFKDGNEGLHSSFFYTFLVQPITAEETTAITGIPEVARTIEGYNIPTPDIMEAYEPGDVRKDVSVGFVTAHAISYTYIKKYCHALTQSGKTGDNWPVYRYAEVLLFIAEALNEQGKTEEALVYLNRVRSRALLPVSSASTQSDVREAIIKERRVELAFENKRWLDLVRTGSAEQVMKSYGERVKANPSAYYFPEGFSVATTAFTHIRILFPLPASEAALSPYF